MASVVIFSRGRGRGHAIPDALIADEVCLAVPGTDITFVSYATGAATFRMMGRSVWDLGLPEEPTVPRAILATMHVLQRLHRPGGVVVVSHEEFAAIPIAKAAGVAAVLFMADWLPPPTTFEARCIRHADEILFLDEPGQPNAAGGARLSYTGRVYDTPRHAMDNRRHWERSERDRSSIVVLVAPGGSTSHAEGRTPLRDLVLDACEQLPPGCARVLWLADEAEERTLLRSLRARRSLRIVRPSRDFVGMLAACDVVITKGNRITVFEAESLGVPSISVSFGVNPIDDLRIARIANNVSLLAPRTTPDVLAEQIASAAIRGQSRERRFGRPCVGARMAARRIVSYLN